MQQLPGQGRPPGGPFMFPVGPQNFGTFGFQPPQVPQIIPMTTQPGEQFAGWRAPDVAQCQFIPQQQQQQQAHNISSAAARGRVAKNGKWQGSRRRSGSGGFNGLLPPRGSGFGQSQFSGDFQRRKQGRGGQRGRHNHNRGSQGNRGRTENRGVNISATCNVTFLDAHEANRSMQDVGERMAEQIVAQVKQKIGAKLGSGAQEDAMIQININLANSDTVADNMGQARAQAQPKRNRVDISQSIYESKYRPQQLQHYICTPSTVQQGCTVAQRRNEPQPEADAQPLVLEVAEGQTRLEWVEQLKTQLHSCALYSEDFLQRQDLKTIQALCVENGLLNATAPCLDLSKTEMIEMLSEKFAEWSAYCCCNDAQQEQQGQEQQPDKVLYQQLPCNHLLCTRCIGESVRFDPVEGGVRIGCPMCGQDEQMESPSISLN